MDTYTVTESVHVEMRVGARTVTRNWLAGPVKPEGEDDLRALDLLLRTGHAKRGREDAKPERRRKAPAKEVDEQ